jgi:hypothetical protein
MSRASAVARIRDAPADLISDSEKARIMTWLQTIPSEERDDYIPTDVNGKSTDYYTRLGVAEGEGHTADPEEANIGKKRKREADAGEATLARTRPRVAEAYAEKQDGVVLKWEVDTTKYPRKRDTPLFPSETIQTQSIEQLLRAVDSYERRLFLNVCGPSGAGKSEALRVLVAKHRHDGRLVLYESNASMLEESSRFGELLRDAFSVLKGDTEIGRERLDVLLGMLEDVEKTVDKDAVCNALFGYFLENDGMIVIDNRHKGPKGHRLCDFGQLDRAKIVVFAGSGNDRFSEYDNEKYEAEELYFGPLEEDELKQLISEVTDEQLAIMSAQCGNIMTECLRFAFKHSFNLDEYVDQAELRYYKAITESTTQAVPLFHKPKFLLAVESMLITRQEARTFQSCEERAILHESGLARVEGRICVPISVSAERALWKVVCQSGSLLTKYRTRLEPGRMREVTRVGDDWEAFVTVSLTRSLLGKEAPIQLFSPFVHPKTVLVRINSIFHPDVVSSMDDGVRRDCALFPASSQNPSYDRALCAGDTVIAGQDMVSLSDGMFTGGHDPLKFFGSRMETMSVKVDDRGVRTGSHADILRKKLHGPDALGPVDYVYIMPYKWDDIKDYVCARTAISDLHETLKPHVWFATMDGMSLCRLGVVFDTSDFDAHASGR